MCLNTCQSYRCVSCITRTGRQRSFAYCFVRARARRSASSSATSVPVLAGALRGLALHSWLLEFAALCALCVAQVDEEASIRANTTVLLGNIAKYLGESTCKRVLLNAFTRALKVRVLHSIFKAIVRAACERPQITAWSYP